MSPEGKTLRAGFLHICRLVITGNAAVMLR